MIAEFLHKEWQGVNLPSAMINNFFQAPKSFERYLCFPEGKSCEWTIVVGFFGTCSINKSGIKKLIKIPQ
jgi:hypothetical protein